MWWRALAAVVVVLAAAPTAAAARRPFPDTNGGIAVFDDQLPDSMTPAQLRFVATHIAGTQKIARGTAERLRSFNARFLVLHYRLAIGDGPVPFWIGSRWASDYGHVKHHDSWFFHIAGRRVRQVQSNWYLMNPDSGWRSYWARRVLYEARLLDDDGVFADSLSVPQYLGADSFSPPLRYFVGERAWTARIDRFMRYEESRLHGRLWFIPNAGSWITTRDRTDYSLPDGVMLEGFAEAAPDSPYASSDWALEMNRVLRLARRGRIVLAQSYLGAGDQTARGFVLASYLLTKGRHSFVNMDVGQQAQWFPEYSLAVGAPVAPPARSIAALLTPSGLYARRFRNATAVANPGTSSRSYAFGRTLFLAEPHGGGPLPPNASTSGWGTATRPVHGSVTVPAHGGVVLLDRP